MINLDGSSISEVTVVGFDNSVSVPRGLNNANMREEYHLTPKDGNLLGQTVLLNGNILGVSPSGDIPALEANYVNSSSSIVVGPHSIVFAHMPCHVIPACNV